MAEPRDHYGQPVLLECSDQPVVSNAIPPEAREIARQRLAEPARILLGRDPLPQVRRINS
jgi:hypothetical protein